MRLLCCFRFSRDTSACQTSYFHLSSASHFASYSTHSSFHTCLAIEADTTVQPLNRRYSHPIFLHMEAKKMPRRPSRKHRIHWSSIEPISEDLHPAPSEVLSGSLLEDAVLFNATKKVENPPDKVIFHGWMAGFWVGIGGITAVSAAGGIPEDVRAQWLSLPKFLIGSFFACGKWRCAYMATEMSNPASFAFYRYVWRRPLYRQHYGTRNRYVGLLAVLCIRRLASLTSSRLL